VSIFTDGSLTAREPVTPSWQDGGVERFGASRFSSVARALAEEARRRGLAAPGFRSPPRVPGAVRTIRRAEGRAVIAVRLTDRAPAEVITDMIEGVVVANRLVGRPADQARGALLEALDVA
jgi:hypothetical protein